jgi:RNA polymerase sigma-70 factor (ECF subfamily)
MTPINSDITDYEVIRKCLNGDNDCFAVLVGRYKNLVYSVILRMINDRDEADDLAQDVFVKVYKNLDKYYPDFKFSTWIMRIATNHVIDYRRKKRMETVSIDASEHDFGSEAGLSASFEESPETVLVRGEEKALITKVIDALPDMYKIPIVLYHHHGLSYQEIADVIEEPLSKVKNRIFRGRKMLRDSLVGQI